MEEIQSGFIHKELLDLWNLLSRPLNRKMRFFNNCLTILNSD